MSLTLVLGNDLSVLNSTDLQEGGKEGVVSMHCCGPATLLPGRPWKNICPRATGKDAGRE